MILQSTWFIENLTKCEERVLHTRVETHTFFSRKKS